VQGLRTELLRAETRVLEASKQYGPA